MAVTTHVVRLNNLSSYKWLLFIVFKPTLPFYLCNDRVNTFAYDFIKTYIVFFSYLMLK